MKSSTDSSSMFLICWAVKDDFILNSSSLFYNIIILIWQLVELVNQEFTYSDKLYSINQNFIDAVTSCSIKFNFLFVFNIILSYNYTVRRLWILIKNFCEATHFNKHHSNISWAFTFILLMQSSLYQSEERCLSDLIDFIKEVS